MSYANKMNNGKLPIKKQTINTETAFLLFSTLFFVCLVAASPYDKSLTLEWIQNATPFMQWWSEIVDQGVFINGRPGLTDITWVALAWSLYYYFTSNKYSEDYALRHKHIFFYSNTILLSLGLTRTLKIIFARPRPHDWFIKGAEGFPKWFELHHLMLPSDKIITLHSSMPSGHSISVICLLGVIPLLIKKPTWLKALALISIAIAAFSVGYGRVIHRAHWVTDCLCSGLFGGLLTWAHYKFFQSLKSINHRKYFINTILISVGLMLIGVMVSIALHYTHKIY